MMINQKSSEKSAVATLLLCVFLGNLGIHRFYVGKWITGILMLLTFGGFGVWYLIDIALIVCNRFTDCRGRIVELAKNPAPFKTVMGVFAVAIILVYGFIIGSVVAMFIATGVLVQVAQDQMNAFRSGDMKAAYSYTTSDFQKNTSLEAFSSFAHQYRFESNDSITFYDRNINGDYGYVIGQLRLQDGTIYMIKYRLHKEGDQWKVFGIALQTGSKPNLPAPGNPTKK